MKINKSNINPTISFNHDETNFLNTMLHDLHSLLNEFHTGIISGNLSPARKSDPVFIRIFPDAYDDIEHANEFRSITYQKLMQKKLNNLKSTIKKLSSSIDSGLVIKLNKKNVNPWVKSFNLARIVLATRHNLDHTPIDKVPGLEPIIYLSNNIITPTILGEEALIWKPSGAHLDEITQEALLSINWLGSIIQEMLKFVYYEEKE